LLETTAEGETIRIPTEVPLVRDRTALFALSWLPMHRIDERSPFFGGTRALERLRQRRGELFLAFTGLDETLGQQIHARHSYRLDDIVYNARFAEVLTIDPDGTRHLDYSRFHDVEVLGQPEELPWAS
jgi:inward rectifier potassium channel